jgi:hypothetical protein
LHQDSTIFVLDYGVSMNSHGSLVVESYILNAKKETYGFPYP